MATFQDRIDMLPRREFLGGLGLLALATGLPLATLGCADKDDVPSERQRTLMRDVSQLVLPRTGTPGAGDAAVGDFVLLALAHGLERAREPLPPNADPALRSWTRSDGSLRQAAWLESELDRRASGDFLKGADASKAGLLEKLDAEAFAAAADGHPWRTIKALILTGYYTSEIGGAEELRYELVPGRWDPDIPLRPGDRAWSSDWTAVEFG